MLTEPRSIMGAPAASVPTIRSMLIVPPLTRIGCSNASASPSPSTSALRRVSETRIAWLSALVVASRLPWAAGVEPNDTEASSRVCSSIDARANKASAVVAECPSPSTPWVAAPRKVCCSFIWVIATPSSPSRGSVRVSARLAAVALSVCEASAGTIAQPAPIGRRCVRLVA